MALSGTLIVSGQCVVMIFTWKHIAGCKDFNGLMNFGNIKYPFHKLFIVLLESARIFYYVLHEFKASIKLFMSR